MAYGKYLVTKPVYEAGPPVKGRQSPSMTYMSNTLVPGCNMYLEVGWIWDMPTPNPHIHEHSHNFDEIVLHIGADPDNPEDLGGESMWWKAKQWCLTRPRPSLCRRE